MITLKDKKNPNSLTTLFFTEMWERFSYYGMRALLVLYLVNSLNYSDTDALHIYAIYTGLVYLTPIIGGYLADRYLGTQKAIFIGGITMMLGHFLMAFPNLLYLAMGLLIIGNGYFKPNISTLLGRLYKPNDLRRDSGFSFFYVGINLGAFLAPLIVGYIGETINWHYGFAIAGIGMFAGLIQFYIGQNKLIEEDTSKQTKKLNFSDWRSILFFSFINIPFILLIFELNNFINLYIYEILILSFAYIIILFRNKKSKMNLISNDIKKILYIGILSLFVIFFWIGFEQAGGSLTLYANNSVDRNLFGFIIPASFFQSINPLIIILLGPLIANFWLRIDNSKYKINTSQKMGLGLILLSCGFFLIMNVNNTSTSSISLWWLVGVYFLHTLGELCLSPIGLSMVTKVSPKKIASLMMGFWFLSSAIANYSAGKLPIILQSNNMDLFTFLTVISFIAGILLIIIAPFMEKLIKN
ncbi:peptide MFS transporter [Methylophilaceae bacterium]|nr:peptide MFS transporter [Methylophilaceae bacterium]|tara:strand:- start:5247 stop:6656 length:1410 start_codon:yes stop_codon:yes gene_type:complete